MTESAPARHEAPDVAELRRLLDAATPRPWVAADDPSGAWVHAGWAAGNTDTLRTVIEWMPRPEDARLIAAAVNALPALLDAAAERDALAADADKWQRAALTLQGDRDALRAELAHMTEARDNARAEVERLAATVEAVREACADIEYACVVGYCDPHEVRPAIESITTILDGAES